MGWEGMKDDHEVVKFKLLKKLNIIKKQGGVKGGCCIIRK
jgi:hypothetical protein